MGVLIVSRNNRRPIYRTFQFRLSKKISYRTSNIEYLLYWKNVISLCFLPRAHSLTQNLSLLLLLKCRSCSLGGYESPWAPGGAIFIPGEIMTRREYWKPFFFTVKSFLEGASWWSQLPLGPNWHLQLLQLTTFGGTRLWAPGSAGVHPGERWTWLFLAWGFFVSLPHFNASSSPISFHSKVLTNEGHHTAAGTLGKDLVNRWSCSYMCPLGYSST